MLLLLTRKEVLSHVLSLRFAVTFVLFIVLIFASIYVAVNEHRRLVERETALARAAKERLDEVMSEEDAGDRVHALFWWEGRTDAVPVSPLSWLGQGVQASYPAAVVTKGDRASQTVDAGVERNPMTGSFRVPDFVYVVSVVLSLLAVLFMFDAVCGEKEAGTLRLVLSNAVPRHTVLLGKWIGGYAVLLVPFLVTVGGGLLYARVRGALGPGQTGRILFLVFIAALYIAAFFNLGLFISTTARRSTTSLLVCLFVWVVAILVVPNLAPVTAKILEPTPSLEKIRAEKAAVDREIGLKMERLTMTSGELDYGRRIELERAALERERERRKRRWQQYYDERRRRQTALAATLGRLSPSVSWTYAAVALTNTGGDAYEALYRARIKLGEEFGKRWEDALKQRRESDEGEWPELTAADLPSLRVRSPDASAAFGAALNDVLVLVILNVIFFMLAFAFFLRYDVR